jgi:hypothetical protein
MHRLPSARASLSSTQTTRAMETRNRPAARVCDAMRSTRDAISPAATTRASAECRVSDGGKRTSDETAWLTKSERDDDESN